MATNTMDARGASEGMLCLPHEAPVAAIVISGLVLAVSVTTSLLWPPSIRGYPSLVWTLALIPAFLLSYYKSWRGSLIFLVVATALLGAADIGRQVSATSPITWELTGILVIVLLAVSLGAGFVSDAHRFHALNALKCANTDAESGLPNQLVFKIALEKEFAALSWGRTFSVALIEVSGVEPRDGGLSPEADDHSLHRIGVVLKLLARRVDIPCRYDDDKFVVLLPSAGLRRAVAFSTQAVLAIADQFEGANRQVIEVSCGVACRDARMTHFTHMVQLAESALHIAKSEGGNRVAVSHCAAGWLEAWRSEADRRVPPLST